MLSDKYNSFLYFNVKIFFLFYEYFFGKNSYWFGKFDFNRLIKLININ